MESIRWQIRKKFQRCCFLIHSGNVESVLDQIKSITAYTTSQIYCLATMLLQFYRPNEAPKPKRPPMPYRFSFHLPSQQNNK
ncbi:hypothetical protein KDH_09520 [Dictyobacter sp. S3.2.2.5]|uniref:Uncharacterized protein n=1 Tax=Dictyobacter halimunensis TaxID=3026934 RepID=A0ABQ6FNJ4_9CHLR|nr:hypothetical protein KDH_09520 [Dictyobacter sp. S3.2.2.5]